MQRTLKIAMIVVIGAVLIASVTVFAYSVTRDTPSAVSPYSYIPSNSSIVVWVNYNGTSFYIFQSNNSTAVLLNSISIASGNLSYQGGNTSYKFPLNYYSSYKGFQIYSINVTSEIAQLANLNLTIPSRLLNGNLSLFAYSPGGSNVVVSSYSGILNSINSYSSGKDFQSLSKFINQTDNISFYYSPTNSTSNISYAWGGANGTMLHAYIEFKNPPPLSSNASISYHGFNVTVLSSHELEVTYSFQNFNTLVNELKAL